MTAIAAFVGRLFLAVLFIHSGISKLLDPAPAAQMISATGLSGALAQPVGIFELVAGLALVFGFMTRIVALLLAAFVLLTALFFHNQFTDPMQVVQFEKNLAIAGGLLALFAVSQMRWSYDSIRERRRGELATREAEARLHDAELRAARAEGRAETVHPGAPAPVGPAAALNHGAVAPRRRWRWF